MVCLGCPSVHYLSCCGGTPDCRCDVELPESAIVCASHGLSTRRCCSVLFALPYYSRRNRCLSRLRLLNASHVLGTTLQGEQRSASAQKRRRASDREERHDQVTPSSSSPFPPILSTSALSPCSTSRRSLLLHTASPSSALPHRVVCPASHPPVCSRFLLAPKSTRPSICAYRTSKPLLIIPRSLTSLQHHTLSLRPEALLSQLTAPDSLEQRGCKPLTVGLPDKPARRDQSSSGDIRHRL